MPLRSHTNRSSARHVWELSQHGWRLGTPLSSPAGHRGTLLERRCQPRAGTGLRGPPPTARSSPRAPPPRAACRPPAGGSQFKSAASRVPPGAARLRSPLLTRRPHLSARPAKGNGTAGPRRRRRSPFERPGAPASFPCRRSSPPPAATNPLGPGRKLNLLPRRRYAAPSAVTVGTAAAPPPPSARGHGGAGASERRGLALVSVSVSPPTPRQFWKLCITSCHRRQPAGAAHKQTPAAPPAPNRGEPRGAAPTDGRGEESPSRRRAAGAGGGGAALCLASRTPRPAPRSADRYAAPRPRRARPAAGRGRSRPGSRGLPPPRARLTAATAFDFPSGERRVRPGAPRGQSAAPRAGGARRGLPRGPAKFAPRPPRGRSRPARL